MPIGFLVSPTGMDNLTGPAGVTVMVGQIVQLIGVVGATVAGVAATVAGYRRGALPR